MTIAPLAERLAGRPLALGPTALSALCRSGPVEAGPAGFPPRAAPDPGYTVTGDGIAVVPILGPMLARGDWLTAALGLADYHALGATLAEAFADASVRAVLMEIDSPGGEVGGLFDLVDEIRRLATETGKPVWAVASEAALSAACAIASAAGRIYVTRTGEMGSIGVVALHVDESAADAMAGRQYTLIHAGARKIDGHPHAPLDPTAHAAIQADVDALHGELVALVARNRGLAPEAIRAMEAATYRGAYAVEAGLADAVGATRQALADLAGHIGAPSRATRRPNLERRPSAMSEDMSPDPVATEDSPVAAAATDAPDTLPPEPAPPVSDTAGAESAPDPAAALRAEFAEIAAIAAQAARLGLTVDAAAALAQGIGADALRRSVLEALATRAEATAIVSTAPSGGAGAESPIIRRARQRAARNT
ncbi:serine protease, ClpP class [Meinhardsimonia xiamenensis]|jgi:ClpP class serine protease|uniref:Serine protease, ClpP class n=1 Tax=Meinhardsimonia xiamenensis TaxID=990712 RepID=A0A1G9GVJ8_9RHOB|nr:S49 family peptidase [Meinhardsimonia xiamenensis]PRX29951.1 ClpP class serine protease [Meinhardsimonia xiamenensis]SDL04624.1 serine protease, ClpP class [Meinhardsimonia xiamenensis]